MGQAKGMLMNWTAEDDADVQSALGRFPRYLYRYVSLEDATRRAHAKALIERGEIYFARVGCFNDPFDSFCLIDSSAEPERVRKFWADSSAGSDLNTKDRDARVERLVADAGSEAESARLARHARE